MSERILVIVPTRGRPDNIARLEAGLKDTATTVADFLYVVDDDDPEAMRYLNMGLNRVAVIHRLRLGGTLNFISRQYLDKYEHIGFMGDDHLPRTVGWDLHVLAALTSDRPRVVYGNDLLQGPALPTAVFMHSKIISILSYMVPPEMIHLYIDNFWKELGELLGGLVYLPDVVIEHLHPAAGKAAMDERYREVNAASVDISDRETWLKYRSQHLGESAEAVLRAYGS